MNAKKITAAILVILLCVSLMLAVVPALGQQASTYTAYGPIGTGPYIYMGTDTETGAIRLARNENYWNKAALQNSGVFGIQELDLQYINGGHAAIAALTAGNVSVINPLYRIDDVDALTTLGCDYVTEYLGDIVHMELNLQHPVFGTGIDTPLGQIDTSKASEAARYVRQAISHLIPRQEIVATVYDGEAMQGVMSGISPITIGYDASLEPYAHNVTLAKQLLAQAGYEVESGSVLFHITLLVGAGAEGPITTANLIKSNFESVGIATDIVVTHFDSPDSDNIIDRLSPSSADELGKTYDQGGFDAAFITYMYGKDSSPYYAYHSSQFPPVGGNCNLWNNTENDRLCLLIEETENETERLEYLRQWQQLFYAEQPTIVVAYPKRMIIFNSAIFEKEPFETYFKSWPAAENWVLKQPTSQTKIAIAVPQNLPLNGFNPYFAGSAYDYDVIREVFEDLTTITDNGTVVPALATSWESSADLMNWTVHLREGVTWHDGVKFNATDVKFTYDTLRDGDEDSWLADVIIVDEYTIRFVLSEPLEDFPSILAYYTPLPSHVLQNVAYEDWKTHPFHTAAHSYTITIQEATTTPTAIAAPTNSFFDQYSVYIIIAAIAIAIIIIVTLIVRQRSKHN